MALIDYLSPEKVEQAGTNWDELTAIQKDFEKKTPSYEQAAQAITNILLKAPGVHSVRYRVKNPMHLLKKIIRKRNADKERVIDLDNYEQELTDLGGVRVLHLFKSDWRRIHKFITETWTLNEKPTAYYREGDSAEVLAMFTKQDCEVKRHPAGYRSVHYIVETSPTRAKRFVEIQVRTIFEEGWSEVDHQLRYPSLSDNPFTNNILSLLNRLAGSADEMSSLVQELHHHLLDSKHDVERLKQEHEDQIKKLQSIIDNSKMSAQDKSTLKGVAKSLDKGFSHTIMTPNNILSTLFANLPSTSTLDLTVGPSAILTTVSQKLSDAMRDVSDSSYPALSDKSDFVPK